MQAPEFARSGLHFYVLLLTLAVLLPVSTGCDQDQDGDGWTAEQGDCDDAAPEVYPGAPELCNGTDDDCDGLIDADDSSVTLSTWYPDLDGDGKGSSSSAVQGCATPDRYVATSGDCDDDEPAVYTGAIEVCDGLDNDCDLLTDEEDPGLSGAYELYPDADQDGYGTADSGSVESCHLGELEGYSSQPGDCADADPSVYPGALEYPFDGLDNDCDGHASVVIRVTAGSFHSLALDDQGRVWAWGYNLYGQLGDGTFTTSRGVPVLVTGLAQATDISAGFGHSLALLRDGTLRAWGSNDVGQLGDDYAEHKSATPVQVTGLTGVVAISAGSEHSLALLTGGTVSVWGYSVACGSTSNCYRPVRVAGLEGVVAIKGGGAHSLSLLQDGSVKAWGRNDDGQLGTGNTTWSQTPVAVVGLTRVVRIEAGDSHSLALLQDGSVKAWGQNAWGQLGDGSTTYRKSPVSVRGVTGAETIAAGNWHSFALSVDGTMQAWGSNREGQLGDGTNTDRTTPVQILGLPDAAMVLGGGLHSLALDNDSRLWAWGDNMHGQLGNGTTIDSNSPLQISTLDP